jgi:hypothetical protein
VQNVHPSRKKHATLLVGITRLAHINQAVGSHVKKRFVTPKESMGGVPMNRIDGLCAGS